MNNQALVEGLTKFQEWAKELALVAAETESDAANELMLVLYKDTKRTEKLLGGSNAPILMDAAKSIKSLRETMGQLNTAHEKLANAIYLNRRNCGGHYYPGIAPLGAMFISDCDYCKCWMGPNRSGGLEGIDQFGDCPENPKLRDAYKLLKDRYSDETEEIPPEEPLPHIDSSTVTLDDEGIKRLVFRDQSGGVMFSVFYMELKFAELVKFFKEWGVIPEINFGELAKSLFKK